MKIRNGKFAVLRLGKNNEVLFSEYIRAKKAGLTKEGLLFLFKRVLNKNKKEPIEIQARKILERLLEIGGIDEERISEDR